MNGHFLRNVCILLCLLFVLSCSKNERIVYPKVEWLKPAEYSQYDLFDTISLSIRVNYLKPAVSLKINLQNENQIPVGPSVYFDTFPTGEEKMIFYVISAGELTSGTYLLALEARDGNIYTRASVTILLNAPEKELVGIIVVKEESSTSQKIYRYDSGMILQDSVFFSGDYAGSAVCSNEGKFFIAGKHSGDLTACTISDFSVCWIYPIVPNPSQPYITCLQMIANQVYAGMWEGSIKRWTHSGIEGISTQLTSETFSTLLFATDNYLISSSQQKSNYQLYQIEVFYQDLGSLVNSVQSDILPIIFSQPATEEILILGNNQAGKACSRMFQPTTGMLSYPYQPFDLPAVSITAAAAVNPETILFATPETVYLYEFEKSNIPLFHQQDVRQIRYEELSRTIWCSTGIKILVFDLNGNKQTEINTSFPAINFHFLYNR